MAFQAQSRADWLAARDYLRTHRQDLTAQLAAEFSKEFRVAETNLICRPDWLPSSPLPLTELALAWEPDLPYSGVTGSEPEISLILPSPIFGKGFTNYAEAIEAIQPPKIFIDRPTYRLRAAALDIASSELLFSRGSYFDSINTGECCAHEYAACALGQMKNPGFRNRIGDPLNFNGRPVNVALSCLTIRRDLRTGQASFPLHWRDPARVAHAGGLTQVIPVGIFQAINADPGHEASDFSFWRCLLREYAEELLGHNESYTIDGKPFAYSDWSFAQEMEEAVQDNNLSVSIVGLGVDPLTLATDLLLVAVFEAESFDHIFEKIVEVNDEGRLLASGGDSLEFWPFTEETVHQHVMGGKMQAAGGAVLSLAWKHRRELLG